VTELRRELGRAGEEAAAEHLVARGWRVASCLRALSLTYGASPASLASSWRTWRQVAYRRKQKSSNRTGELAAP